MHLEDGLDIGAPFHYRSYPLYWRSCALLSARPPARIRGAHVLEGSIARSGDCPSKFGTQRSRIHSITGEKSHIENFQ